MAMTNDLWNLVWKQDQHNYYMFFTTHKYANNHGTGIKLWDYPTNVAPLIPVVVKTVNLKDQ